MIITLIGNCQLESLKFLIEKFSKEDVIVDYIVSFQNLKNVSFIKETVKKSDLVILQPIRNYEGLRLEDIQSYIDKKTSLLVFPFIRFSGFWDTNKFANLKKFSSQIVKDFPLLKDVSEVDRYLSGGLTTSKRVLECFEEGVEKLHLIEKMSDIKFSSYFDSNYRYQPLFADQWHPTPSFNAYIQREQLKLVDQILPLDWMAINNQLYPSITSKCSGHFTPLNNKVRLVLDLKYSPEYFIVSRKCYLNKILDHELNSSNELIDGFRELHKILKA